SHGYGYCDAHSYGYRQFHTHAYAQTNTYAEVSPVTEASSHASAETVATLARAKNSRSADG
ncbi:MAG TPA: hypothetical protein VE176_03975, partial [Candidatus Limnocylindrales bacterium]|nr:hypothetical protein [Candidatus Limnocylindrales bacterium]